MTAVRDSARRRTDSSASTWRGRSRSPGWTSSRSRPPAASAPVRSAQRRAAQRERGGDRGALAADEPRQRRPPVEVGREHAPQRRRVGVGGRDEAARLHAGERRASGGRRRGSPRCRRRSARRTPPDGPGGRAARWRRRGRGSRAATRSGRGDGRTDAGAARGSRAASRGRRRGRRASRGSARSARTSRARRRGSPPRYAVRVGSSRRPFASSDTRLRCKRSRFCDGPDTNP